MTLKKPSWLLLPLLLPGVLLLLPGCASKRPVLYPNAHYDAMGPERVAFDVDTCIRAAEAYGAGNDRAARTAEDAAQEATTGAVVGGAVGAVRGGGGPWSAGRTAAAGATAGGTRAIMGGIFGKRDPAPVHRAFVEQCLRDLGYQTIGWD